MIPKERIRKIEIPFILCYLAVLLVVYIAARIAFEMYTFKISGPVYLWFGILMSPFIIYATLRLAIINGGKWFLYPLYFVLISIGVLFTGGTTIAKLDLLLSSTINQPIEQEVPIVDIKKVFRRSSFKYTDVTIQYQQQNLTLQAQSNTYFLLESKKTLKVSIGQSYLGNYFVTDLHLQPGERGSARWAYLKDWTNRNWYIPAFVILFIAAIVISAKYFPNFKIKRRQQPMGFWQLIGIVMGIVFSLGLLLYLSLLIYVKFFV